MSIKSNKDIKTENEVFKIYCDKYQKEIDETISEAKTQKIVERIWDCDYTVWSKSPSEITNRLGWLKSPAVSFDMADEIYGFAESVRKDGITNVLLLGMGGSSLAPEVFSYTFGSQKGFPELSILDSTHPEAILEYSKRYNPEKTLYIVSTKSGGTVETFSFMKFFYNKTIDSVGKENAGKHFTAITDPGSGLEKIARQLNFRKIFLNDPNIGGRYSALSLFGIVPAALIGIDIKELLNRAKTIANESKTSDFNGQKENISAKLGILIGQLAKSGRDKITFITSDKLSYFGNWIEQLIAESTGKSGKGILPVVGEAVTEPSYYYNDRLFVYLKLKDDNTKDERVQALINAGFPVIEIILNDIYDLGGEYFRWEFATVIAGWVIGIQPFDQPNVEAAKVLAREMLSKYLKDGKIPQPEIRFEENGIKVYSDENVNDLNSVISQYFGKDDKEFRSKGNQYISIQAYIKPDESNSRLLQTFRTVLQKKYKSAVTVGYGPRFLHSTGQLHKGDAGKGVFIQIISKINKDVPIPDNAGEEKSGMTFGVLITSQAFGDRQALIENGRKVVTFQLDDDTGKAISILEKSFSV